MPACLKIKKVGLPPAHSCLSTINSCIKIFKMKKGVEEYKVLWQKVDLLTQKQTSPSGKFN